MVKKTDCDPVSITADFFQKVSNNSLNKTNTDKNLRALARSMSIMLDDACAGSKTSELLDIEEECHKYLMKRFKDMGFSTKSIKDRENSVYLIVVSWEGA